MEKEDLPKPTPPPVDAPDNDGTDDAALLRAISAHPECARVLAAIANGGDRAELLGSLLPKGKTAPEESITEPVPEVAMYCSPTPPAPANAGEPSCPMFLANVRPDFWDGF